MTKFLIPPSSTIGILGGGQLGRMLAQAASSMGYHVHVFCPEVDCPAREVSKHATIASYDDRDALLRFARDVDVATYEFENIPAAAVKDVARHTKVFPSLEVLETAQHRVREKQAVNTLGIATAPFMPVASQNDLEAAIKKIGTPAVLKTSTMGYDGKGQWMIKSAGDAKKAWDQLQVASCKLQDKEGSETRNSQLATRNPLILEGFVDFKMEISVIVARGQNGEMQCYTPVENIHKNHILAETIVPARITPALAKKAEVIAKTIAEGLELVGLMAVEMFVTKNDELLVNELAPRPHNSGHWTIDAAVTSQFEQTIRAICGLPLGSPEKICDARMINLIGDEVNDWKKYASAPNAKIHLYGKKESRPGRKMGHVTFLEN
jgi:5-(carboxyamino)imidazole ribonucleotide synthase